MNCTHCGNSLPNEAKFCNKCGKAIEAAIIPKEDIEKRKKSILNTGNSVYAIGWLTLLINVGIYAWSILDNNFSESGLPVPDLPGTFIMIVAASVFIILGSRIKRLVDKNIKTYLKVLLGISLLLFIWIISSGGRVGILFFLIIAYLISSLISINKLMKVEEFTSTLTNPKYKLDKRGWIIFAISALVLFFVAAGFDSTVRDIFGNGSSVKAIQEGNNLSKEELVRQIVESAKSQTSLPSELDSVTTLSDIVAEPSAIRYEYILHDLPPTANVSNAALRDLVAPEICKNTTLVEILGQDIYLKYSYVVRETNETYATYFSKGDCPAT
jgi:zinc-ribbon domain